MGGKFALNFFSAVCRPAHREVCRILLAEREVFDPPLLVPSGTCGDCGDCGPAPCLGHRPLRAGEAGGGLAEQATAWDLCPSASRSVAHALVGLLEGLRRRDGMERRPSDAPPG